MNAPQSDASPSFAVAEAVPAGYLDLAALDRRAWAGYPNGPRIVDGEHTWRHWCEDAVSVVARDEHGGVIGAAVAFACRDGRYCVHKVMTDPDHRGRGVATAVFKRLLEILDVMGVAAFLTVDPANASARKLYERLGFGEGRHVRGYYRPEEDRLVMVRPGSGGR